MYCWLRANGHLSHMAIPLNKVTAFSSKKKKKKKKKKEMGNGEVEINLNEIYFS